MAKNESWNAIFEYNNILKHNFDKSPFYLNAKSHIKPAVNHLRKTSETEVRILCKMDTREYLPEIMKQNQLFLLPIKNGEYVILKGDGYVDIPEILTEPEKYKSKLDFELDTSLIGNSEMQHLDFAYASSLIRTFTNDHSLVLTVRGRKYAPDFAFRVGNNEIAVRGVQTEVDAGYEGRNNLVLIEAKNGKTSNTIIRQIYYPLRQWQVHTNKKITTLFFEKRSDEYLFWQFAFEDEDDYNSIYLANSKKFTMCE